MENEQNIFIVDYLQKFEPCEIKEKYVNNIKQISIPIIEDILKYKTNSGTDMKAMMCMFDTIMISSGVKNPAKGIYDISNGNKSWMKSMNIMNVNSKQGFVYISKILSNKIQIIIKTPRDTNYFNQLLAEYFIGIYSINNLRYKIPTFAYTLGAFIDNAPGIKEHIKKSKQKKNSEKSIFILYEKIEGESLGDMLRYNFTFKNWLIIFLQVLFSLEIAQRECSFTHFDLHCENLMVKNTTESYSFLLDDKMYTINNGGYTPVIIDFGMSTTKIDNKTIGIFGYSIYGVVNFMIQGYDMYKYMISSIRFTSSENLRDDIKNIFKFYGNDDPYNIFLSREITTASVEFCKRVSYSKAGTYTPMMLINWLLDNYPFLKNYLSVKNREVFNDVLYLDSVAKYDEIFSFTENKLKDKVTDAFYCLKNDKSYINGLLFLTLLKHLDGKKIDSVKHMTNNIIEINKQEFILNDMYMLNKFFLIKEPDYNTFIKNNQIIMNIMLYVDIYTQQVFVENRDYIIKNLSKFSNDIIVYNKRMLYFSKMYYIILQTKSEDIFSDWITKFLNSSTYIFYIKNLVKIQRMIRWVETINSALENRY